MAFAVLAARGSGRDGIRSSQNKALLRRTRPNARRVGVGGAKDTTKHRRRFVLVRSEADTQPVSRAIAGVHRLHLFS